MQVVCRNCGVQYLAYEHSGAKKSSRSTIADNAANCTKYINYNNKVLIFYAEIGLQLWRTAAKNDG